MGAPSVWAGSLTQAGYFLNGVEQVDPQSISDGIADSVLGQIVTNGSVSIDIIHERERKIVFNNNGLPVHSWTFSNPVTSLLLTGDFRYVTADDTLEYAQVVAASIYGGLAVLGSQVPPMSANFMSDQYYNSMFEYADFESSAIGTTGTVANMALAISNSFDTNGDGIVERTRTVDTTVAGGMRSEIGVNTMVHYQTIATEVEIQLATNGLAEGWAPGFAGIRTCFYGRGEELSRLSTANDNIRVRRIAA